jgi:hypothetical protein
MRPWQDGGMRSPGKSEESLARRKRQLALANLLDRLAYERGHLDTPEDEAEIARYMRQLAGSEDPSPGQRLMNH